MLKFSLQNSLQKFENPSNNSASKYNIARVPSFRKKKQKILNRSLKH